MQRAIIGAFVMTLCMSILGGISVWGVSANIRAGSPENARRLKQGLPRDPLWYESLWKVSPDLILSGAYICLCAVFAFFVLKECGFFLLNLKSGLESPYDLYVQCTPMEFWIGCSIWAIPLFAALFIFARSAIRLNRQRHNLE